MVLEVNVSNKTFDIIMGTNAAPILTNIYVVMLEKELTEKYGNGTETVRPVFFG